MLDWKQCRRRLVRQRTLGTCYLYVLSILAVVTVFDGFPPGPLVASGEATTLLAAEIALLGPAICGYLDVGPAYPVYGSTVFLFALVVSRSVALPLSGLPDLAIVVALVSVSATAGSLLGTVGFVIGRVTDGFADDRAHLLGRSM
ncbi:hypothetical protein [Halorientalis pallida]|uniref:Uncharacterized protein n=1 Tax=Halorientalis pallida TaxID=2479928 RepID=A0A498KZG5_9EURY|nr:hypothetical protein [Halorientalis pallida]RXK51197.1 hypothetical protein EAF64_00705 [Halorientalis pallida]